jgi:hypothetical protein
VGTLRVRLCRRRQAHQPGEPRLMDRSSLLKEEGLMAVGPRAETCTDLIEQATAVGSRAAMSEPAHRPISLVDATLSLFQMMVSVAIRRTVTGVPFAVASALG